MTASDRALVEKVKEAIRRQVKVGCTGCGYCMPCPAGVDIPRNFRIWNHYHIYGTYQTVKWAWEHETPEAEKAKNCIKCGKCEALCPQKIRIREDLERAQADLDQHKG